MHLLALLAVDSRPRFCLMAWALGLTVGLAIGGAVSTKRNEVAVGFDCQESIDEKPPKPREETEEENRTIC